jgi:hypothetical protein
MKVKYIISWMIGLENITKVYIYNLDHSGNKTKEEIITHREKVTLQLRKNKLDKSIMTKRFKDFDFYEEYKHLQIKPDQLNISEDTCNEFDTYDEKYSVIENWLDSDNDYFKLGIYKLRELSREYDDYNDEGIDLPYDVFSNVILILENTEDNILLVNFC